MTDYNGPTRATSIYTKLSDAASNAINNGIDSAKSFYKSAQRGAAQAAASKASSKSAPGAPTVRRDTSDTPTGTDTATKNLGVANAAQTVSGAPSQIDKAIASMDH